MSFATAFSMIREQHYEDKTALNNCELVYLAESLNNERHLLDSLLTNLFGLTARFSRKEARKNSQKIPLLISY